MHNGISEWDWRYRVGYDPSLRKTIRLSIERCPVAAQRAILTKTYDWARQFVSMDRLIEAVATGEVGLTEIAEVSAVKLLHVPGVIEERLAQKIDALAEPYLRNSLMSLLNAARVTPYRDCYHPLFEITVGAGFAELLRSAVTTPHIPKPTDTQIFTTSLLDEVSSFEEWIKNDERIRAWLTRFPMPEHVTVVRDGNDNYAEYWPSELSEDGQNTLILYRNPESMKRNVLRGTLLHELYPGHGLFYDIQNRSNPGYVDHGSTLLLEGWATWCEWHAFDTPYARASRSMALRSLRAIQARSAAEAISIIDELRAERGDTHHRIEQLNAHFQYPGYSASYPIGALWLERHLTFDSALDFLLNMDGQIWGDFFCLWSRKVTT